MAPSGLPEDRNEMSALAKIRLLMLAVVSPFALWLGVSELRVAVTERTPTVFAMESFAASYDGQAWIEVEGRLAAQHAVFRESERGHYITAPVVEPGWDPSAPVHVLVTFGPLSRDEAARWQSEASAAGSVRGLRRSGLAPDDDERWQGLRVAEPRVHLNEGGEPNLAGGIFMSALFCLGALISGAFVFAELRGVVGRRARRSG